MFVGRQRESHRQTVTTERSIGEAVVRQKVFRLGAKLLDEAAKVAVAIDLLAFEPDDRRVQL